jgi:hypothetical protein
MTARAQDRDGAYARWAIGSPYQNIRIETVRLRFGHSLGLPATNLLRHAPDPSKVSHFRRQVMNIASAAVGAGVLGLLAAHTLELDPLLLTGGGAAAAAALGVGLVGRELQTSLARLGPSDTLEDLAAAIVEGLRDAGALRAEVGTDAVRLLLQDDGFYRCYLEHATREESALFAEALDELLAPLAAPRYIIPRYIAPEPPGSAFGALVLAARLAARGRVSERVVYHAVPSYLAANKARVQAFERAWQRHVSAGNALFFQDPRARAILEVQAGENPFEATSQMRTLWQ